MNVNSSSGISQVVSFLNKTAKAEPTSNSYIEKFNKSNLSFDNELSVSDLASMQALVVQDVVVENGVKDNLASEDLFIDVFGTELAFLDVSGISDDIGLSDDKNQMILARFAMKFLFPDKAVSADVLEILGDNENLKNAVAAVLAQLDDGGEAIKMFMKETGLVANKQAEAHAPVNSVSPTSTEETSSPGTNNEYRTFLLKESSAYQSSSDAKQKTAQTAVVEQRNAPPPEDEKSATEARNRVRLGINAATGSEITAQESRRNRSKAGRYLSMHGSGQSEALVATGFAKQFRGKRRFISSDVMTSIISSHLPSNQIEVDEKNYSFREAVAVLVSIGTTKPDAIAYLKDAMLNRKAFELVADADDKVQANNKKTQEYKKEAEGQVKELDIIINMFKNADNVKLFINSTYDKVIDYLNKGIELLDSASYEKIQYLSKLNDSKKSDVTANVMAKILDAKSREYLMFLSRLANNSQNANLTNSQITIRPHEQPVSVVSNI